MDNLVDISVRCMRTNPELVAYAERHAGHCGVAVDELLAMAARRREQVQPAKTVRCRSLQVLRGTG